MPEEKVRLNNGVEYTGSLMESKDTLWLFLKPGPMAPYFEQLNIPRNTIRITYINWGEEIVYTGYNHLFWIKEEPDMTISVGLQKV